MLHHLQDYRTISIDLNNTLMNQIAGIVRASKGNLVVSDFDQWDVDLSCKMKMTKAQYLEWAWSNPYSELLSPAFDGAAEQLVRIHATGRKIWIVTATVMSYNEISGWLGANGMIYDRIIKTKDKRGIGDVLIDDSPTTCKLFAREGLPILRYELPWNSHINNVVGVRWQ